MHNGQPLLYRGLDLRAERELRGIRLEELSRVTKYSIRQLRDFEAGRFDRLPGDIFLRGMIRMYIQKLGLDPGMVQLEFIYRYGDGRDDSGTREQALRPERRIWDAQLGPLAGFFLITGVILVLLWPEKDRDSRNMLAGSATAASEIRLDRRGAEAVMDIWLDADISLMGEMPLPDHLPTIRTHRGGVRIETEASTWVRVQDMVTGAEELYGLFPGEYIHCSVKDEMVIWLQNPDAVRIVDPVEGRLLSETVPGVIRFVPGGNRYIIHPETERNFDGGSNGKHSS